MLELAPTRAVGVDGTPVVGRFAGRTAHIDWSQLGLNWQRSALWRQFHHKRWQYIGIAGADFFIGCAVVDVGWTNTAFAYLFDRSTGRVMGGLSRDGVPGLTARVADVPQAGARSHFAWMGATIDFRELAPGRFVLHAKGPDNFAFDAEIDGSKSAPWMFACNAVEGGVWHSTHKSSAMAVSGTARAGGKVYQLDGSWASQDHSNGLLPRRTQWLWASAHAEHVGFNLQSGYFGDNENALWLNGQLIPLGTARFSYDETNTLAPWSIRTDDGLLDLRFSPEGERREDRNLLVAVSRYVQPVGVFEGTVRASLDQPPVPVEGLLGVAEQHESKW